METTDTQQRLLLKISFSLTQSDQLIMQQQPKKIMITFLMLWQMTYRSNNKWIIANY